MVTPVIETQRMLLRPLCVSDADVIFRNWTSDPDVAKYMVWNLHTCVEDTVEWLKTEEDSLAGDNAYTWGFVLKETGELFGSGGIRLNEEFRMFELGYNIMSKHWNKGLTTEAASAIILVGSEVIVRCPQLFIKPCSCAFRSSIIVCH